MSLFIEIANSTKSIPILFSFLLGVVGTLAPCQLTGNISAMTLYGNQSLQKGISWKHILLFILGKTPPALIISRKHYVNFKIIL